MATDKEQVKLIIASDYWDDWIILKVPDEKHDCFDGNSCDDNGFTKDSLPAERGVYEVDCEIHWDDGHIPFSEPADPDWWIKVLSYRKLLPL
jgi:hypothetical protein